MHKYIANFEISTAVDVPADVRESPIYPLMLADLDQTRPYVELYDLDADPWEQTNLAGWAEVAATAADLRGRLLRWMQETGDPLLHGPVAPPTTTRRCGGWRLERRNPVGPACPRTRRDSSLRSE